MATEAAPEPYPARGFGFGLWGISPVAPGAERHQNGERTPPPELGLGATPPPPPLLEKMVDDSQAVLFRRQLDDEARAWT